jgi:hypothetical protein
MGKRRRRVEPTDDWEQLELLCGWVEQREQLFHQCMKVAKGLVNNLYRPC